VKIIFSREKKRRLESLDYFGLFSLAALLAARFFPFHEFNVPLCGFRTMTGLPCPGCGMTTCYVMMTHGRFADALATSPAGVILFAGSVLGVLYVIWRWLLGGSRIQIVLSLAEKIWVAVLTTVILMANWIYLLSKALAV
jgi:hypothetical protein